MTVAATGAREHRVELFATVLLAVAAIATAWSTFQAGRWRGEQAVESNKSQAARIQSSEAHTRAGQLTQIDIATFIQWVNAHAAGQTELAAFYRNRFRAEFRPALDNWIVTRPFTNPQAPSSPFVLPAVPAGPDGRGSTAGGGRDGEVDSRREREPQGRRLPARARPVRELAVLCRDLDEDEVDPAAGSAHHSRLAAVRRQRRLGGDPTCQPVALTMKLPAPTRESHRPRRGR